MSGGKTQTTETSPWSGATEYLSGMLEEAQNVYNKSGEEGALNTAQRDLLNSMSQWYANGAGGTNQVMQDMWTSLGRSPTEVAQSQEIQDMISANTAAINQDVLQSVMPAIRSGATSAGQYGGTRQGVAEGVATGQAAAAAQQYGTQLMGNIYQQQLQNQINALKYTPTLQTLLGQELQGQYDIETLLKNAETDASWANLNKYANLLFPAASGGQTSVQTGGGTSTLQGAAGGAAAGTAIMPGWGTAIGAVLGALAS
jgi:hypothetical protein